MIIFKSRRFISRSPPGVVQQKENQEFMAYTLAKDGDSFEKKYWDLFLGLKFPSYEKYWNKKVTPLTQRPTSIHFKSSSTLLAAGIDAEEVCKAQLHYTILRQLVATYECLIRLQNRMQTFSDSDVMAEGLFHIGAAQDVAFEFLQRMKTPGAYDPWTASKRFAATKGTLGSKEACAQWKEQNNHPLNHIREYRNHLTHGRMLPELTDPRINKLYLPKIGQELNYLDWRVITDPSNVPTVPPDFDSVENILENAWLETMTYLEREWQIILAQIS